ncbi:MAG TPA: response regulator transcription factor [Opitutaceae bacterium]|nr:response regulator transcription factor [Opitutaceae bacterium]
MSALQLIEAAPESRFGMGSRPVYNRQAYNGQDDESSGLIRVFIAEDQPLIRKGLETLINEQRDMEVVGQAWERNQALRAIKRLKPDIVVMELYLCDDETIGMIRQLNALNRSIQIVVLSRHDELVYAVPAFKVGAKAFVMKQEETEAVVDAIRKVHRGKIRFSWNVSAQMLNRMSGLRSEGRGVKTVSLSPREVEVVALIAAGLTSREIANRLEVSIKTIEAHRAHIKQKANLESSTALVRYSMAVANEISPLPAA